MPETYGILGTIKYKLAEKEPLRTNPIYHLFLFVLHNMSYDTKIRDVCHLHLEFSLSRQLTFSL